MKKLLFLVFMIASHSTCMEKYINWRHMFSKAPRALQLAVAYGIYSYYVLEQRASVDYGQLPEVSPTVATWAQERLKKQLLDQIIIKLKIDPETEILSAYTDNTRFPDFINNIILFSPAIEKKVEKALKNNNKKDICRANYMFDHEAGHIKSNDALKFSVAAVLIPLATHGLLNTILRNASQKSASIRKTKFALQLGAAFPKGFIKAYMDIQLLYWYYRTRETKADCYAYSCAESKDDLQEAISFYREYDSFLTNKLLLMSTNTQLLAELEEGKPLVSSIRKILITKLNNNIDLLIQTKQNETIPMPSLLYRLIYWYLDPLHPHPLYRASQAQKMLEAKFGKQE